MLIFKFVKIKLYAVFPDNFKNHLRFSRYVPITVSKVIYLQVCVCVLCDQTCHTFAYFILVLYTNPDLIITSTSQKRFTCQEIAAE